MATSLNCRSNKESVLILSIITKAVIITLEKGKIDIADNQFRFCEATGKNPAKEVGPASDQ